MSNIEEIVDSLENKISKILHKQEVLKQTNVRLSLELQQYQQQVLSLQDEISSWAEKYQSLKIANSMLGSNEDKRDTKLKINTLIREIDTCIAQLSE